MRVPTGVAYAGLALALGTSCTSRSAATRYLDTAWESYRTTYVHPLGYVLDLHRDGGTVTSEGQGYALLTAVWSRDSQTFARVFSWTEATLRREDGLYAWLWSPVGGGGGGVILDSNTATDADQEIAFALLLAARAFGVDAYRDRARELLLAIRRVEFLDLPNGRFPAAGNWAVGDRIVNLSYFLPYAYPYFASVDPDGDWLRTLEQGYALLELALESNGRRLIPDFMVVSPDGHIRPLPPGSELSEEFSFDAMRLFWRVAADCRLHRRPRACADPLGVGRTDGGGIVIRDGQIFTRYTTAGRALSDQQSLSFYGSLLPALRIHAPALAAQVEAQTLTREALAALTRARDRYYDRNWVWFGLALDGGMIERRTPPALP